MLFEKFHLSLQNNSKKNVEQKVNEWMTQKF
jgi:hypothetical protein